MTPTAIAPPDLSLDLLNWRQMQEQLDLLREQLTESQRLATIGTIAAVIAHEFNNLLTPIVSYSPVRAAERRERRRRTWN